MPPAGTFSGFLFLTIILHNSNIQKRSCFISDKDEIAPWFHFTLRAHLPSSFLLHNVQDPCRTTHFFPLHPASFRTHFQKTLVSGSFQPHLSAILCETILIFYFFRSKPFSVSVCSSLCKFFLVCQANFRRIHLLISTAGMTSSPRPIATSYSNALIRSKPNALDSTGM